jgi:hypothetical protein
VAGAARVDRRPSLFKAHAPRDVVAAVEDTLNAVRPQIVAA